MMGVAQKSWVTSKNQSHNLSFEEGMMMDDGCCTNTHLVVSERRNVFSIDSHVKAFQAHP
jgi:hypothetical protein